jgi:hypothetical protein
MSFECLAPGAADAFLRRKSDCRNCLTSPAKAYLPLRANTRRAIAHVQLAATLEQGGQVSSQANEPTVAESGTCQRQ